MDSFPHATPQNASENEAADHARRSVEEARAGAEALKTQGTEAMRKGAARAREAITHGTDLAAEYVQAQPFKSLVLAAAAGAAVALLAGALGKRHTHH